MRRPPPAPWPDPLEQRLRAALAARRPRLVDEPGRRLAAVAVITVPAPDSLLFIRRSERQDDPWSGHVAFPGGGHDPGDASLLATAIRETREELGCDLDAACCLGTLDDVAPRTPVLPPVTVRPFVFHLPRRPELLPGPEVASAFWVPLAELVHPGAYVQHPLALAGVPPVVSGYALGGDFIWGMTERILTPLLEAIGLRGQGLTSTGHNE